MNEYGDIIFITKYYYRDDINPNTTFYSDRLYQWDWEKYNKCHKEVWGNEGQMFCNYDFANIEKFLNLYYPNRNLKLIYVEQQENASNGFPYWRFECYTDK